MIFGAIDSDILYNEFADDLLEISDWLSTRVTEDPDEECRTLAQVYLHNFTTLLQKRNEVTSNLFSINPVTTTKYHKPK